MNLLSTENLGKKAGTEYLFKELSLGIHEGDKIALVGKNGSGKSTFISLITGQSEPDEGSLTSRNDLQTAVVSQALPAADERTVEEFIFSHSTEKLQAVKAHREASLQAAAGQMSPAEFEKVEQRMNDLDAWRTENDLKAMLAGLNVPPLETELKALSGGMRKKAALVAAFVEEPDLLILDEPTNHLDLDSILWLGRWLQRFKSALLLVTHDRWFLDTVCSQIWELEDQTVFQYEGRYNDFLEKKAERMRQHEQSRLKQYRLLKQELEWASRQPKARRGKSKSRLHKIETLSQAESFIEQGQAEFSSDSRRMGKKILEVKNLTLNHPRDNSQVLINKINYSFVPGEKIALVGPNGCGKTTLLELLTGERPPDSGHVSPGLNTHFGFFRQGVDDLDNELSVLNNIKKRAEYIRYKGERITAGKFLEMFMYTGRHQAQKVGLLSGGERQKLQLLSVLITAPNFLLLDEPTNDLDLMTLGILEEFLQGYEGNVVLVSHDLRFIEHTTNSLWIFQNDGSVINYPGSYPEYREQVKTARKTGSSGSDDSSEKTADAEQADGGTTAARPSKKPKTKLSYKEQREHDQLQKEIEALEVEQAELKSALNGEGPEGLPGADRAAELGSRYVEVEEALLAKLEQVMDLLDSLDS